MASIGCDPDRYSAHSPIGCDPDRYSAHSLRKMRASYKVSQGWSMTGVMSHDGRSSGAEGLPYTRRATAVSRKAEPGTDAVSACLRTAAPHRAAAARATPPACPAFRCGPGFNYVLLGPAHRCDSAKHQRKGSAAQRVVLFGFQKLRRRLWGAWR